MKKIGELNNLVDNLADLEQIGGLIDDKIGDFNAFLDETKPDNMKVADQKRFDKYAANPNRPCSESLLNALKKHTRVYVESGNYGGVYPVIATTGDGNARIFNPWGYNTREEMFTAQQWPESYYENGIITEYTATNKSGMYKVEYDGNGKAISFHPTLTSIVSRLNDGNIRVTSNPRDPLDAISKGYFEKNCTLLMDINGVANSLAKRDSNGGVRCSYSRNHDSTCAINGVYLETRLQNASADQNHSAYSLVQRDQNGGVRCSISDSHDSTCAINKAYLTTKLGSYATQKYVDEKTKDISAPSAWKTGQEYINFDEAGVYEYYCVMLPTGYGQGGIVSGTLIYDQEELETLYDTDIITTQKIADQSYTHGILTIEMNRSKLRLELAPGSNFSGEALIKARKIRNI